jgi:hypothetical protein
LYERLVRLTVWQLHFVVGRGAAGQDAQEMAKKLAVSNAKGRERGGFEQSHDPPEERKNRWA